MYDAILVPTDGSETANRAAEEAFRVARGTGATVHLLYVMDESPTSLLLSTESMGSRFDRLRAEAEQLLADLASEAEGVTVKTAVRRGNRVYRGIVDYVGREEIDLVVMGSAGRQGPGGVLGSTTQRVVEHCAVPVLVVPDTVDPREETDAEADADDTDAGTDADDTGE